MIEQKFLRKCQSSPRFARFCIEPNSYSGNNCRVTLILGLVVGFCVALVSNAVLLSKWHLLGLPLVLLIDVLVFFYTKEAGRVARVLTTLQFQIGTCYKSIEKLGFIYINKNHQVKVGANAAQTHKLVIQEALTYCLEEVAVQERERKLRKVKSNKMVMGL